MQNKSSSKHGYYPFQITCCVPEEGKAPYPSYTQGLARNCGMPEFIINYQAFGADVNAAILHFAYDYFVDPKNSGKLNAILNGKIIKLTGKQLSPAHMSNSPLVFCFREVSPFFEGIQQAYGKKIEDVAKKFGWRFIQIWVDGDDFALEDEYYRNDDI
jgi:hypothetical protein